jgi:hypothetical protein
MGHCVTWPPQCCPPFSPLSIVYEFSTLACCLHCSDCDVFVMCRNSKLDFVILSAALAVVFHEPGSVKNNFAVYIFRVLYFHCKNDIYYTAVPLICHLMIATTEIFIIQCGHLGCSLLTEGHARCYQAQCHSCFHMTIIFKFVGVKILCQEWKQPIVVRRRIHFARSQSRFSSYGYFFRLWRNSPTRARAASFLTFLDHT